MKKIRLTENQLIDLIKKSLNEVKSTNESQIISEVTYVDSSSLTQLAKNLIGNMTGDVDSERLKAAISNLSYVRNMFWEDGTCGIDKLLAYYKGRNSQVDFLTDLKNSYESGDPEFDDLKAKIPNLIAQLQQACVAVKKQEADAVTAKANSLESCASKEPGYVDYGEGKGFGIAMSKKGYLTGWSNGAAISGRPSGHNVTYWEYAKYHPKEGKDVALYSSTARCLNGVFDVDTWVKI